MKTHPLFRKTALTAALASASMMFGGPVLAAQAADADATSQAAPAASEAAAPGNYVTAQDADQLLAKDLIGLDVKNEEDKDKTVGKISDVILDRDGSISGIVVGVGGFLGLGEKDVGMPWDRIQSVDSDDKVVRVDVSKDELKDAPEYKKAKDE